MARLERVSFGSKLGVILATAGSAVGLGNIWRFPYMAGQNGGAVFIVIYVFCVLLLGLPCMISEFIIGRHGKANTARAYSDRFPDLQLLCRGVRLVLGIYVGLTARQASRGFCLY